MTRIPADQPARIRALDGSPWEGKKVMVAGLARSGLAAAELLLRAGASPLLYDQVPQNEQGEQLSSLLNRGCTLRAHQDPIPLLCQVDALVISPGIPLDAPLVQAAIARGLPWMGELELASRFARGKLCALTGTNGKTTTVSLLGEIFRQAGKVAHVCGNIGYPLSAAALASQDDDILIAEVSSFQMESVTSFHPHIAAVLNLTPDHLNRHLTMANYAQLKRRIFMNQDSCDYAVLNFDDAPTRAMADKLAAQTVWFSRNTALAFGAYLRDGYICVRLQDGEQTICKAQDLKIPGLHNLDNALAAAAIAGLAGVPPAVISYAFRTFAGVEHRIEFVRELDGVRYINDSKGTNPDASIKALEAMSSPTVLLAGGFDKQVSFDLLAQKIAQSALIQHVVVFGQTAKQIAQSLDIKGFTACQVTGTLEEALEAARSLAQPGFNVLLSPACASFDQFTDYEQRGQRFKELVRAMAPEKGTQDAGITEQT